MPSMDDLVRRARVEATDELRERLREYLLDQPLEWLVEQLVNSAMAGLGLAPESGVGGPAPAGYGVRPVAEEILAERIRRYWSLERVALEGGGYLLHPPAKGGPLIGPPHRTAAGEELLAEAKGLLYALLFGAEAGGVRLERVRRELLTLTVPRAKATALAFLRGAATEIDAEDTWRDPRGAVGDGCAANTLVRIEYGETASELVGGGIVASLRLINELEINELVLYGRTDNVEQSTLV
jgi:hypothetical protein